MATRAELERKIRDLDGIRSALESDARRLRGKAASAEGREKQAMLADVASKDREADRLTNEISGLRVHLRAL